MSDFLSEGSATSKNTSDEEIGACSHGMGVPLFDVFVRGDPFTQQHDILSQ